MFIIENGPGENMYVFTGSHFFVYFDETDKEVLLKTFKVELSVVPPFPVFVEFPFVQHAGPAS